MMKVQGSSSASVSRRETYLCCRFKGKPGVTILKTESSAMEYLLSIPHCSAVRPPAQEAGEGEEQRDEEEEETT